MFRTRIYVDTSVIGGCLDEEFKEYSTQLFREFTSSNFMDVRHIAIAPIERVDVLVSWNFKHIVNLNRIHQINSVNLKLGYPLLEIRSPMEVIYDGQEV
jgi:hypothetical protein